LKLIDLTESKETDEVKKWVKENTRRMAGTRYSLGHFTIMPYENGEIKVTNIDGQMCISSVDFPKNVIFDIRYVMVQCFTALDDFKVFKSQKINTLVFTGSTHIKSFDGLMDLDFKINFGQYIKLPESNWRALFKYNLKDLNASPKMVSWPNVSPNTKELVVEVIDCFNKARTLLEFQSLLIDHDLESYF
jgi:hypothetical protein